MHEALRYVDCFSALKCGAVGSGVCPCTWLTRLFPYLLDAPVVPQEGLPEVANTPCGQNQPRAAAPADRFGLPLLN